MRATGNKIKFYAFLIIVSMVILSVFLFGITFHTYSSISGNATLLALANENTFSLFGLRFAILINIVLIVLTTGLLISLKKYFNLFKKQNEQVTILKSELTHNLLTGLYNKTVLLEKLQSSKNAKLILVDIDEFRKINNFFSYEVGDNVLCYVANKLKEFAYNNNLEVFSVGGDLFALYEDVQDENEDRYFKIINEIKFFLESKPFVIEKTNTSIVLTFTIGICLENEDCFKKANIALKKAKKSKDTFAYYSQHMINKERYQKQIDMANIIKDALKLNQVVPFYQPIINRNGDVIKYEALVRIVKTDINGNENIISPNEFLQESIRLKYYNDIQKLVFLNIVQKLSKNQNIQIAINMSARDIKDNVTNDFIIDIITKYNIAKNIIFEILENEDMSNNKDVIDFLSKVRALGSKIALDDFGTGYSNFSYLLEFNPDYIKIDGSLIKDMNTNAKNHDIVKLIVAFAKNANIKVVAEFVCSKEVFDMCMEMGIDEFQGFYIGKPDRDLSNKMCIGSNK